MGRKLFYGNVFTKHIQCDIINTPHKPAGKNAERKKHVLFDCIVSFVCWQLFTSWRYGF